ncbi:MAG: hypothetical protein AAF726_12020 [Planctomycetota bacterium]
MPKNDINAQIQARVESFTDELSQLVREAALEAVQEALDGGAPRAPRGRGRRPATQKKAAARHGGKRIRRSEAELQAIGKKVLTYVKKNPGSRLEQISAGLEVPSAELKQPVAYLLGEKALRKTGQRRGTKYSASKSAK